MIVIVPDLVGGVPGGIAKNDSLVVVRQASRVVADDVRDGGKGGQERVGVLGDDQKTARFQQRVGRKLEANSLVEFPAAQVDRACPAVVQLEPLFIRLAVRIVRRLVVIHDFVDDDVVRERDQVGRIRRRQVRAHPVADSIRMAAAWTALYDDRVRNT